MACAGQARGWCPSLTPQAAVWAGKVKAQQVLPQEPPGGELVVEFDVLSPECLSETQGALLDTHPKTARRQPPIKTRASFSCLAQEASAFTSPLFPREPVLPRSLSSE